jgi:hypothetical protein
VHVSSLYVFSMVLPETKKYRLQFPSTYPGLTTSNPRLRVPGLYKPVLYVHTSFWASADVNPVSLSIDLALYVYTLVYIISMELPETKM